MACGESPRPTDFDLKNFLLALNGFTPTGLAGFLSFNTSDPLLGSESHEA